MGYYMLQKRIDNWQRKTFPSSNELSKIKHLKKEIDELEEAIKEGHSKKEIAHEIADCVLLLFGIAGLQGINLLKAVRNKLKINMKRKWGKPDKDGVYFHEK